MVPLAHPCRRLASAAFQHHKVMGMRAVGSRFAGGTGGFLPCITGEGGEVNIPCRIHKNFGQVQPLCQRQAEGEQVCPPITIASGP